MLFRNTTLIGTIAVVLALAASHGWAQETVGGKAATPCDMAAMCAQVQAGSQADADDVAIVRGEAATPCDMAALCAAQQAGAIVPERDPARSDARAATACDMAALCADLLAAELSGQE